MRSVKMISVGMLIACLIAMGVTTTAQEDTTEDTITEFGELPRAYTQQDLNVLVGNVQRPNGIVYFEGDLYTACNGDWTLYRIDAETGDTITFVFGVRNAHQLTIEATDLGFDLWIPDFDTNQFVRIDQTQTSPQLITSNNLDGPWGIIDIGDEEFLISNVRSNNIVRVDGAGNSDIVLEGLRAPAGMATDTDNEYVYVANNSSARRAIEWFRLEDLNISEEGTVEIVEDITQPLVSGLQNTSGMLLADDGYLYFTYALGTNGVVGRVDPVECRDGGCNNEDVEIVLYTDLTAPLAGLTITPDMRLFVHTIYRPELYWVDLYE